MPICTDECAVGEGAVEGNTATYLDNTQGCRDGYTCLWAGLDQDPTGGCAPGLFNEVTDNNIGDACADNDECYSPFGNGSCDPDFGCTVTDCAAAGMPGDVCGDNAVCVDFISVGVDLQVCLEECSSAEDCLEGSACVDGDGDPLTLDSFCFFVCLDDEECRSGEVCDGTGSCVPAP